MSIRPQTLMKNQLLDAFPIESKERLFGHLRPFEMPLGKLLYEPAQQMDYLYFPMDGIVSLLSIMLDGSTAEIAVVGHEGVVGISAIMGSGSMLSEAIIQISGSAWQLPAAQFSREFDRSHDMRMLMLRYVQTVINQMAQTAVCNRHHTIDQQFCRWLLLSMDRLSSDKLTMTQLLIANMLGVRREGVTEAAGKLQRAGIIRYKRGLITVIDRAALEERSCECYEVVRRESERIMGYDSRQQDR